MAVQIREVTVWIISDRDGCYEVGTTFGSAAERFEDNHVLGGEETITAKRVTVAIPLPQPADDSKPAKRAKS